MAEEDEIYRRGLLEALGDDTSLHVAPAPSSGGAESAIFDVVVASEEALRALEPSTPVVILSDGDTLFRNTDVNVVGVLPKEGLTAEKLLLAVRAAGVGLRVEAGTEAEAPQPLDPRRVAVLRQLAAGADTKAIARRLKYSERTIKTLIHDIQQRLGTQTRAQTVAEAIRRGLI